MMRHEKNIKGFWSSKHVVAFRFSFSHGFVTRTSLSRLNGSGIWPVNISLVT